MKKLLLAAILLSATHVHAANLPENGLRVYGAFGGSGSPTLVEVGVGVGYVGSWKNTLGSTAVPLRYLLMADTQVMFSFDYNGLQWNTFATFGLEIDLPQGVFLAFDVIGVGGGLITPWNGAGGTFVLATPGVTVTWGQLYGGIRTQYLANYAPEFKGYLVVGWDISKYLPGNTRHSNSYQ